MTERQLCSTGRPSLLTAAAFFARVRRGLLAMLRASRERLRGRKRLASSQERFKTLTQMSGDWYWETDASHAFTDIVAAPGYAGAGSEASLHKAARWERPGMEGAEDFWPAHRAALRLQEPFQDLELRRHDASGRPRYLRISGEPMFDRAGHFCGYRGVGHDITAQKEAEQALNASESQLAAIIDSAMDAIITVDASHRIVVFNESASVMFGYRRADALGSPLDRLLPLGLDAIQAARLGRPEPVARRVATGAGRVTAVRRNGEEFPVDASISLIEVNGHELSSVILRDVTEPVASQKAREALEAQLRESQKMEALGTMAGGIAHDFNNIVAAILGNAALAHTHLGDVDVAGRFIEEISKAGLRARDLVQRIMAFSRRQPAVFYCQPLQPLIEEAVQLLRATLPSGIEICRELPEEPLYLKADATQISQVLMNLGTNAWQALGSQPGRISIVLQRHGDCEARISVTDNGCGMDEATSQRIFEPFFTTKAKGEGTGLGLPVVNSIVRAHGGRIHVQSRKGEGTTFEIVLPLACASDATVAAPPRRAAGEGRGAGQHVVYLDDYPAMVFMMKATLKVRGYRVTGFEDASQALDFVREHLDDVDLIVSDYNMPGQSGLEVARKIRQLRADLPVIVASGCLTDELREGAARAGVTHLFDKPRGIDEMCEMIGDVLRGSGDGDVIPKKETDELRQPA